MLKVEPQIRLFVLRTYMLYNLITFHMFYVILSLTYHNKIKYKCYIKLKGLLAVAKVPMFLNV